MTRALPDGERLQELKTRLLPLSLSKNGETDDLRKYYLAGYGLDFVGQLNITGMSYSAGHLDLGGIQLSCNYWSQEKSRGTVFLLHGYFDHVGLFGHLIQFYLEQGFSVFAYDLPGHGLSGGPPADIDCFSTYTYSLKKCLDWGKMNSLPEPWHLSGQSTGGAIITDLLAREGCTRDDYPFGKVILLAPLVRPVKWKIARLQYRLLHRFIDGVPRSRSRNSHDAEFLEFLNSEPLQSKILPMGWVGALNRWITWIENLETGCDFEPLIIQGQNDGTVDWRHNLKVLKRAYKSVDVYFIPEGRHHLANEGIKYRQCYYNWLRERLGC